MGVFDKIKNALFEEEYVEVEEKPKKPKRDLFKKDATRDKKREEKPIAKKVVLPEKKEIKVDEYEEEELVDEDFEIKPKKPSAPKENPVKNNFKIMEDNDFKVEPDLRYSEPEPKIVKVIEKEEANSYQREEKHYYDNKPKEKQPYGISDSSVVAVHEYGGAYEKKEDKTYFKPSPIISPIYGILDKNYKKEELRAKDENSYEIPRGNKKVDFESVHKKAFGSLADDIKDGLLCDDCELKKASLQFQKQESDDLLYDITIEKEKVEEKEKNEDNYENFGVSYEVEDSVKNIEPVKIKVEVENKTLEDDIISNVENEIPIEDCNNNEVVAEKIEVKEEKNKDNLELTDDLFNLIDSMYQDKEE